MKSFYEFYERAAERKGGVEELESLIPSARSAEALAGIGDDRWLSEMTRSVFQAGFVWRVVSAKWPAFETAFEAFDPHAVAYMDEGRFDELLRDQRLIRHHAKMRATRENAVFLLDLAQEHGSAAKFFATWPDDDYVGLLEVLKKRASRMGGTSAQYYLRRMGKNAFILTQDVIRVLIAEDIVTKAPTAKRDRQAVQEAFNYWAAESGRGLTAVSRVLALSVE